MPVVLAVVLILAAFAAVLCVRAANVKPRRAVTPDASPVEVDGAGAAERLAQLVRIPTVSDYDESKVDDAQFETFRAALRDLLKMLGMNSARELMRQKEDLYKELNLADSSLSEEALIQAMVDNPKLMERPIVVANGKARIGRPPEQVLEIVG